MQQKQLVDLREEITLYLRNKLNNFSITIDGEIKKSKSSDQRSFTSSEKFDLLAKENPALLQLRELLQLESGY